VTLGVWQVMTSILVSQLRRVDHGGPQRPLHEVVYIVLGLGVALVALTALRVGPLGLLDSLALVAQRSFSLGLRGHDLSCVGLALPCTVTIPSSLHHIMGSWALMSVHVLDSET